jgi:hypothetical protein
VVTPFTLRATNGLNLQGNIFLHLAHSSQTCHRKVNGVTTRIHDRAVA